MTKGNLLGLLILCLLLMNCSKDPPADQDPEDEENTGICVPELLSPLAEAQLDNGCSDSANPVLWSFDWEDCENSSYQLVVQRTGDPDPLIDDLLDESEFSYLHASSYIPDFRSCAGPSSGR